MTHNGLDQRSDTDDTSRVRGSVKLASRRSSDGASRSEDGNVGKRTAWRLRQVGCGRMISLTDLRIVRTRVGDVQANVGGEEAGVARVLSDLQGEGCSERGSAGSEKSDEGSAEHDR